MRAAGLPDMPPMQAAFSRHGVMSLDLEPYGCRWLRIVRPGDRYIV